MRDVSFFYNLEKIYSKSGIFVNANGGSEVLDIKINLTTQYDTLPTSFMVLRSPGRQIIERFGVENYCPAWLLFEETSDTGISPMTNKPWLRFVTLQCSRCPDAQYVPYRGK